MWNYRIIKREVEGQPDQYGLFEVFYNDEGEISAHSEEPELVDASPEELLTTLRLMLDDAQKSYYKILKYGEIEFAPLYDEKDLSEAMTLEEFEAELKKIDVRDLTNDTIQDQSLNNPPLSWTDPDVDVDESDYGE
jgi:hypothetical protein